MTDLRQMIFDKVATHLLKQNKRSVQTTLYSDRCMYRGPDGLQCAIGCLIRDPYYHSWYEERPADDDAVIEAVAYSLGVEPTEVKHIDGFLFGLQRVHDEYVPKQWPKKLKDFAEANEVEFHEQEV